MEDRVTQAKLKEPKISTQNPSAEIKTQTAEISPTEKMKDQKPTKKIQNQVSQKPKPLTRPLKKQSAEESNNFLIGGEYNFKDTWKGGKFEELHSLKSQKKGAEKHEFVEPENRKFLEVSGKHENVEAFDKHVPGVKELGSKELGIKELRSKELEITKSETLNPFSDSHTIEEQIYFLITALYILTRTYTLFKRTNRNKISKLGHLFIHFTLFTRFFLNSLFLFLKTSFPFGKQTLESKYFLESKIFLNFFSFKLNLSAAINNSRLFADTIFISSLFLFASKYFSTTSQKNPLKKLFIIYSFLRIPVFVLFFNFYFLTPSIISSFFVLEIAFLCLFLFTQSVKLSVSGISATKTVYVSIVLLLAFGALNFGRFLGSSNLELETSFLYFVIHKAAFFVFLLLACYLVEMFMKRTKSDFYDYFDEELTISTTNKGVQYYVS